MTTNKDEALKLAIEYMTATMSTHGFKKDIDALKDKAIEACKSALSEEVQEPFGYFKAEPFGWTDCHEDDEGAKALYERPAKPIKRLTDEQIGKCMADAELPAVMLNNLVIQKLQTFANAIMDAMEGKNNE